MLYSLPLWVLGVWKRLLTVLMPEGGASLGLSGRFGVFRGFGFWKTAYSPYVGGLSGELVE